MTATRNAGTDPVSSSSGARTDPLLPSGERAGLWPGAVLSGEQPFKRSWIGARHVEYLHRASRPCHQRDRATADSERRSHRGQRSRSRLAVRGSLTDPDHQGPIVLPAHAGTGRPGPDPDSNMHPVSVRPARRTIRQRPCSSGLRAGRGRGCCPHASEGVGAAQCVREPEVAGHPADQAGGLGRRHPGRGDE